MTLLEVLDLSFSRDGRELASGVSFNVREGSVLRIEGPNGSGKTTLLRVLAGLYSNYEGEIRFHGKRLSSSQRSLLNQHSHYLGHAPAIKLNLTARENLEWHAALKGYSFNETALDAALTKVGLSGYEDVPCRQMSAGQQRRVGLARLFLVPARLWLLDEPFTALDKHAVAALEGWVSEFVTSGGAVVLTTHHELQQVDVVKSVILGAWL